ncbi:MAG TPA: hypothetical protein VJ741_01825, partial [Solirubrobacteraceae bacterium]|nr:hypothetical protein [Solirubrobacteraceae bacterium]
STKNTLTHSRRAPARRARLSHVALAGRRGTRRGQTLVFTVSARTRVRLTLARADRNVFRLTLSAHQGQNHFSLTSFLRGRHLAPEHYVLTVRAGNRTVRLKLTA